MMVGLAGMVMEMESDIQDSPATHGQKQLLRASCEVLRAGWRDGAIRRAVAASGEGGGWWRRLTNHG
jgi:hypothetical protein